MVIRSARLALVAKDAQEFDAARARIDSLVVTERGYIDALQVQGNKGEGRTLSATLRFPANRLDDTLKELRTIGVLKQENQNSADVTRQFIDLSARTANARNTEQRLSALIRERTGNLKDVLEVEREVTRVREEIERMEAERKDISQQVAYSTVRIDLAEDYHAKLEENIVPSGATRLRNAGVGGYQLAIEAVLSVLIFALQFGPTLLLLAIALVTVTLLAWWPLSKLMKTAALK
jgi:hypothetical protein